MNVMKIVLAVVDFDGVGPDEVRATLEEASYPNRCISPSVMSVEVRDIGEWEDSNPLNFESTHHAEMDRLFGASDLAALQKDAARFRWIRNNPQWIGYDSDFRPDEVEKQVDAAMSRGVTG